MDVERFLTSVDATVSALLAEGRKEDAIKQHPNLTSEIEELVQADPSGNLKFLSWQVKMLAAGEDIQDVIDMAELFHKYNSKLDKKDINAYSHSDFPDLKRKLGDFYRDSEHHKKTKKQKHDAARCEQKVIYEDENVIVRHILGKKASVHYGQGTKWCITMAQQSHFEQYTMSNAVFFFVFKKKPLGNDMDKVAVSIERDSENNITKTKFFDAKDDEFFDVIAAKQWGESFEQIMSSIEASANSVPPSPIAKLSSGKATPDEITAIYNQLINNVPYVTEDSERVIDRILGSSSTFPSEIINGIANHCMADDYFGASRFQTMLGLIDREELNQETLGKLAVFRFSTPKQTKMFRENLFDRVDLPNDVYLFHIENIILDPSEVEEYQLAAVSAIPSLPDELQIKLTQVVDEVGRMRQIYGALLKRKQPLCPEAINKMVNTLVTRHLGAFRPGVSPDRSQTAFSDILKDMLLRNYRTKDVTDYAAEQMGKVPAIEPWLLNR